MALVDGLTNDAVGDGKPAKTSNATAMVARHARCCEANAGRDASAQCWSGSGWQVLCVPDMSSSSFGSAIVGRR
jgi:hypothetical protein